MSTYGASIRLEPRQIRFRTFLTLRVYTARMHITQNRTSAPPPRKHTPPAEVGADKTVSQHVGNAGFGAASVAAFTDSMGTLIEAATEMPGVEMVPGLNLAVVAVEGYNSMNKLKQHDPIVAATSGGNAAGALGTFLGQMSIMTNQGYLLGVGAGVGAIGGALGIAAGVAEIKAGREIREAGGSSRTLVMGCLDMTSGTVSLAGAGAMALGAGPLGVGLMMGANVVDLAGIGVDYLWKRAQKSHAEVPAEEAAGKQAPPRAPATLNEIE
jgi:hypothetical protein